MKKQPKHGRTVAVQGFLDGQTALKQQRAWRAMAEEVAILKDADKWALEATGWDSVERVFFGIKLYRINKHGFGLRDPLLVGK